MSFHCFKIIFNNGGMSMEELLCHRLAGKRNRGIRQAWSGAGEEQIRDDGQRNDKLRGERWVARAMSDSLLHGFRPFVWVLMLRAENRTQSQWKLPAFHVELQNWRWSCGRDCVVGAVWRERTLQKPQRAASPQLNKIHPPSIKHPT